MPAPKDPIKAIIWRERIIQTLREHPPDNRGVKNPFYGRQHTEETKRKISEGISGEKNGNFGKPRPQYVKDAVGKAHKGKVGYWKGKHLSEKNKGKQSRLGKRLTPNQRLNISNGTKLHAVRGKDNPRWKGGISPETQRQRHSFEYKEWRREVFERDKFICQNCGYAKGHIIIVHHIRAFSKHHELRYDVGNGITICKNCHQLLHSV